MQNGAPLKKHSIIKYFNNKRKIPGCSKYYKEEQTILTLLLSAEWSSCTMWVHVVGKKEKKNTSQFSELLFWEASAFHGKRGHEYLIPLQTNLHSSSSLFLYRRSHSPATSTDGDDALCNRSPVNNERRFPDGPLKIDDYLIPGLAGGCETLEVLLFEGPGVPYQLNNDVMSYFAHIMNCY